MIVYFLKKSQENELSPNFYDVVIMDIDGCLTDSGRNISNANLIAIDAVKKLGVTMILATGRSAYGTWHVLEKLNAVGLHVASNGACITSWPDKRNEIISPVESNSIPTVINTLNSNRIPWAAFGEEEVYCDAKDLKNIEKILLDRQDIREGNVKITGIKSLDSWSWSNCGSISKIWCYLDISEAIKSKNLLEMAIPNVQVSRTTNETIEFFAQEASKISAVREILDRYNKFDAKTLVFGDHDNDLKVMAWGDHAVAPFNASVQVKGLGSVDTFSVNNDEDFVAEAMKEYFGIRVDSFNT